MATWFRVLTCALMLIASEADGTLNLLGAPLRTCSQPGTAMTGFTRDGRCADVGPADAGAHHVCIQMKSDFCTVTGQPNWCTTRDFPCMGKRGMCKIGNWCVCQWAFSRYLQKAGGCDAITDLVCEATNKATIEAYKKSSRAADKEALKCIQQRCGLLSSKQSPNSQVSAVRVSEDRNVSCDVNSTIFNGSNTVCWNDIA